MPKVVIGNVYDLQKVRDSRVNLARARATRERLAHARAGLIRIGALPEDESGLTIHHEVEVDPELKGQVERLSGALKNRGIWVAAAGGLLLGLLLAGMAYWYFKHGPGSR